MIRHGTDDAAFRQLLSEAEVYTEQHRERLARGHDKKAEAARQAHEALLDLAEATGGVEGFERAGSRPCPTCHARPGAPCVNVRTGKRLKALHDTRTGLRELAAKELWQSRRSRGRVHRYDNARACGSEMIAIHCTACGDKSKARPKGCDQSLLCPSCSTEKAHKRRSDFGRARGRVLLSGLRNVRGRGAIAGPAAKYRRGGRYTDKMLTLTVPHFDGAEVWDRCLDLESTCDPRDRRAAEAIRKMVETGSSTVMLRVAAIFLAWPKFWRRLRAHMERRGQNDHNEMKIDRFFEWTPGKDQEGHPHFHCWLWSPYLCDELVNDLWTDALRSIGIPISQKDRGHCAQCARQHACPTCEAAPFAPCKDEYGQELRPPHKKGPVHARRRVRHVCGARAWVQRFKDFDARAIRELMKGGARSAISLSGFESDAGVVTYAGGWSIADVVGMIDARTLGELEIVLTGKRLAQGSAGLFKDDEPPSCPCCGRFGVRVAAHWSSEDEAKTNAWNIHLAKGRAPPWETTETGSKRSTTTARASPSASGARLAMMH